MKTQLRPRLLLFAALICSTACHLDVSEHEVLLDIDTEADTLELLFIYKGVSLDRMDEGSVECAQSILAGERIFGLGLFLACDLEELEEEDLDPADSSLLNGIRVKDVAAFLDEQGRLSCYQHITAENARAIVSRLNELISAAVLEGYASDDEPDLQYRRTIELNVAAARREWTWLRLDGARLIVEMPLADEDATEILREMVAEAEATPLLLALLSGLARIAVGENRVRLVFGDGSSPIELHLTDPDSVYSRNLHELLLDRGTVILDEIDLAGIRNRLHG